MLVAGAFSLENPDRPMENGAHQASAIAPVPPPRLRSAGASARFASPVASEVILQWETTATLAQDNFYIKIQAMANNSGFY